VHKKRSYGPRVAIPQKSTSPSAQRVQQTDSDAGPLSLQLAQQLFERRDYQNAYEVYSLLHKELTAGTEKDIISDFLQLRMAICCKNTSDIEQAGQLFQTAANSRSPIIKTIANYELCRMELQNEQYLKTGMLFSFGPCPD
jgi:Tfp pilus assembly protein PilF